MKIAYVEHPVSKEEKKKYLRDYDRILDIRFAPAKMEDGSKKFPKAKAKAKAE